MLTSTKQCYIAGRSKCWRGNLCGMLTWSHTDSMLMWHYHMLTRGSDMIYACGHAWLCDYFVVRERE